MLFPGISTDHVILAVKSVRKKIGVLVAIIWEILAPTRPRFKVFHFWDNLENSFPDKSTSGKHPGNHTHLM